MNKLFTKVATLSVGLAMAIGVGVAVGSKVPARVDATSGTVSIDASTTNDFVAGYTTSLMNIAHTTSNVTANIKFEKNNGTNVTNYCPVSSTPRSETRFYNKNIITITAKNSNNTAMYITSMQFTCSSHAYATSLASQTISGGTAVIHSSESSETKVDFTGEPNVTSISFTSNATIGFTSLSVTWSDTAVAIPTVTSVTVTNDSGTMHGSYKGDAYIQCSATVTGTNNPSQTVSWSLNTSEAYASTTSVDGASIDTTGKVWFTKNVTVYAYASSTVSGYTDKNGHVACTASGLLDPVTYVKIDKTGRLSTGLSVVIVNDNDSKAMSVTQNGNNRPAEDISATTVGVNTTTGIIPTKVQVFELVAGNVSGSYSFSFKDGNDTKYLYAAGSGSNSYLRTTTTKSDAASFMITITNSVATIKSCDDSKNGYMRYNSGSTLFSCYATADAQKDCSIYMVGSSLPEDVALSTITNATVENVQVDDSVILTASYTPTNATELIEVSASAAGKVTFSNASMSNGTYRVTVTGVSAVENLTITLVGEDTSSATTSTTITVTSYSKTHDIVTSSSDLFNGKKVIIGNKITVEPNTYRLAASKHNGGNSVPASSVPFANDGLSLSNVSGNAVEYTIWNLTIKDKDQNDVTGWAFYDDGYFLTSAEGNNNYLKRTLKLTSLCLFTITISTTNNVTTCSIVAADTHSTHNTMMFNVSSTILGCYLPDATQSPIQLYSNQSSSDANIVSGYERAFLKIGDISVEDQGKGYCESNGYYSYAKDVYTNVLTSSQKGMLSNVAKDRLSAWATANEETFDPSEGTFTANQNGRMFLGTTEGNTSIIVIIIAVLVGVAAVGGYFLFKKKEK